MILTISVWSSGGPGPIHPGLSTFHIPYSHVSIPVHFIANFTSLSFILPCFHQLTQHFCTFSCLLISMIPFIHVSILSCLHDSIHSCFHTVMSPFLRTNQRGIRLHKFLGLCTDLLPAPMFSSLLYLLRVSCAINRLIRVTSSY